MSGIKVGVVVDGHGDYAALRKRYLGRLHVLKTSGHRGHATSASSLVSSSLKEVEMLKALGCETVCILTDRESRHTSAPSFCQELRNHLPQADSGFRVVVACADRMLENWILADIVQVSKKSKELKSVTKQKPWEGKHGKSEIRKLFARGCDYNEVRHGEKFFNLIRESIAKKNSASFSYFMRTIGF